MSIDADDDNQTVIEVGIEGPQGPAGDAETAADVEYDNSGSGLVAEDVQEALDEIALASSTHAVKAADNVFTGQNDFAPLTTGTTTEFVPPQVSGAQKALQWLYRTGKGLTTLNIGGYTDQVGKLFALRGIDVDGQKITTVADPDDPQDAATKVYVDTYVDTGDDALALELSTKKSSDVMLFDTMSPVPFSRLWYNDGRINGNHIDILGLRAPDFLNQDAAMIARAALGDDATASIEVRMYDEPGMAIDPGVLLVIQSPTDPATWAPDDPNLLPITFGLYARISIPLYRQVSPWRVQVFYFSDTDGFAWDEAGGTWVNGGTDFVETGSTTQPSPWIKAQVIRTGGSSWKVDIYEADLLTHYIDADAILDLKDDSNPYYLIHGVYYGGDGLMQIRSLALS